MNNIDVLLEGASLIVNKQFTVGGIKFNKGAVVTVEKVYYDSDIKSSISFSTEEAPQIKFDSEFQYFEKLDAISETEIINWFNGNDTDGRNNLTSA